MKLLLLTLLLVSCCKPKERVCKTVSQIGGCSETFCGAKFTDGTFTSDAIRPVVGATMCTKGSIYRIQED